MKPRTAIAPRKADTTLPFAVPTTPRVSGANEFLDRLANSTAYHEAGHSVIAIAQGIGVQFATIKLRWGAGRTRLVPFGDHICDEREVRVCMAGSIVERIYMGRAISPLTSASDREDAAGILARLPLPPDLPNRPEYPTGVPRIWKFTVVMPKFTPAQLQLYRQYQTQENEVRRVQALYRTARRRRLRRETHVMVRQNWSAITAVAEELLKRKTLSGVEIRRIIRDHRPAPALRAVGSMNLNPAHENAVAGL